MTVPKIPTMSPTKGLLKIESSLERKEDADSPINNRNEVESRSREQMKRYRNPKTRQIRPIIHSTLRAVLEEDLMLLISLLLMLMLLSLFEDMLLMSLCLIDE